MYCFLACKAEQYMTRSIVSVAPDVTMRDLEAKFEKYDFNSFPVMHESAFVGLVTKLDFLRTFIFTSGEIVPHYEELMKRTVAAVMTTKVEHVDPEAPLTRVLEEMVRLNLRSFPVLNEQNQLVGMLSRGDIIRALKDSICAKSAIGKIAAGT